MKENDDPLWYDRAEPDEPANLFAMILVGSFAVTELAYKGMSSVLRALVGGAAAAFRDVRP